MKTAIEPEQIKRLFPKRKQDAQKGDFGYLLCITGSRNMPGACMMAAQAALRCGVGRMTVATAAENIPMLAANCWESMYLPLQTDAAGFMTWHGNETQIASALQKATAVLIGCGMGVTAETARLVTQVIQHSTCPVIIDADGLNVLCSCIDILQENGNRIILTPHPGEMARLMQTDPGTIQADRIGTVHSFCSQYPEVVLALKGSGTLVGSGSRMQKNSTGNPGMSRGGSGDVLAGMIASFAAQGMPLYDAACAGVYLHGLAGDLVQEQMGEIPMLPRDVIAALPEAFREILR